MDHARMQKLAPCCPNLLLIALSHVERGSVLSRTFSREETLILNSNQLSLSDPMAYASSSTLLLLPRPSLLPQVQQSAARIFLRLLACCSFIAEAIIHTSQLLAHSLPCSKHRGVPLTYYSMYLLLRTQSHWSYRRHGRNPSQPEATLNRQSQPPLV